MLQTQSCKEKIFPQDAEFKSPGGRTDIMSVNGGSDSIYMSWGKTTVQPAEMAAMPSMASAFAAQSAPAALLIGRAWSFDLSHPDPAPPFHLAQGFFT